MRARRCHLGECTTVCRELVDKTCACGQTTRRVQCCEPVRCQRKCGRPLECGRHTCRRRCCSGACPPCEEVRAAQQDGPTVAPPPPPHPLHPLCIPLQVCNRWLRCKNHRCAAPCHSGTCPPCPLTAVIACACGSARYRVPCGRERTALPPRCDKLCSMPALCRHAQQLHDQPHTCHYGPCPPCPLACGTQVRWGCVDGPTSLACHPVTHAPLCPRSAHVATHARRLATTRCHPLCPSTSRHRLQTPCSRTGAPPGPLPAAVRSSRSLQRHLLPLQQLGMLVVHAAPARRARWQ